MIQSAGRNRAPLFHYIAETPELINDALAAEDWDNLEEMLKLLKPFDKVSKLGQEKRTTCGSIRSAFRTYEFLLTQLESWEKAVSHGPGRKETGFRLAVNLAWNLLKKYYGMTDKSHVYVAAMVLDL